jgi:hypothetical protein
MNPARRFPIWRDLFWPDGNRRRDCTVTGEKMRSGDADNTGCFFFFWQKGGVAALAPPALWMGEEISRGPAVCTFLQTRSPKNDDHGAPDKDRMVSFSPRLVPWRGVCLVADDWEDLARAVASGISNVS